MKSRSSQKVLKIGSSIGVTIPAKEARYHGIRPGDKVRLHIESKDSSVVIKVVTFSRLRNIFRK